MYVALMVGWWMMGTYIHASINASITERGLPILLLRMVLHIALVPSTYARWCVCT